MTQIHNVRWPEIDDEHWPPIAQTMALVGAALVAWAIVIGVVAAILF